MPEREYEFPELEIEEPVAIEDGTVAAWRVGQFRSLGFDDVVARELGSSGADLAISRSLVASGCPLDLAARILL